MPGQADLAVLAGAGRSHDELGTYPEAFRASWLHDELSRAHNFKPWMSKGLLLGTLMVGVVQVVFLYNLVWSYFKGRPSGGNPWNATTLEWQTPDTPPKHGNFGPTLPVVYRWAYDYSVPGADQDFIPQNVPAREVTRNSNETQAAGNPTT